MPLTAFAVDCIAGLSATPKSLPCKWLYDDAGSSWFERITSLSEYYPSRVEEALLATAAGQIDGARSLVELGSGASRKTRLLLSAGATIERYVPIDINHAELARARSTLCTDYPDLAITPVCADFTVAGAVDLGDLPMPVLIFFPGSTLANMAPPEAVAFLTMLHRNTAAGTRLLIGVDLLKDDATLRAAYDDAAGVIAAFNLNLLERMRRELGAVVDASSFRHSARWNPSEHRIEMHLEAMSRQEIAVLGRRFTLDAGETIHTENSYKLSPGHWQSLFDEAGWRSDANWRNSSPAFLLALLSR